MIINNNPYSFRSLILLLRSVTRVLCKHDAVTLAAGGTIIAAAVMFALQIMTVIFNLAWISLVLDAEVKQPATADGSK
jgi:hypothetical protein